MFTARINLRQLNHSLMTTPKGTKVIVIPIADNNIFEGEKGLYLDIVGFERKEVKENEDTHLLKQSFPKAKLEAMTDEQKRALPIIGNARITSGGGQRSEPEPKDANHGSVASGIDDLPF